MIRTFFFITGLIVCLMPTLSLQAQSGAHGEWQDKSFSDETPVINQIVVDDALPAGGGVLWVATADGLWRFDGNRGMRWDTGEAQQILSLLVDEEDQLWIGTDSGLILLNAERDLSEPLPELLELVWALEPAADGGVWLGTEEGLYHVSQANGMVTGGTVPVGLTGEAIQALAQVPTAQLDSPDSSELWIGTRDSGLFLLQQGEGGAPQVKAIAARELAPRINALLPGEEGELWIGTEEHGLCRLTFDSIGSASNVDCNPPPFEEFEGQAITGLFPDSTTPGALWIAAIDRLWRYAPDLSLPNGSLTEEYRADVRSLVQDGEGQLWAGTTTGLLRHTPPDWLPLLTGLDDSTGLSAGGQDVLAIAEDNQGILWAGTAGGLLRQTPGNEWQAITVLEPSPVKCLFASKQDGSLWACLDQYRGVAQVDGETSVTFLEGETVNDIWQGDSGILWFATTDGIWQKNGSDWTHHPARDGGLGNAYVFALADDGQGGFWAGTLGGLSHFDGSAWLPSISGVQINDLVWDGARSQLWAATSEGLALYDGEGYRPQPLAGELADRDVRVLALQSAVDGAATAFVLAGTYAGLSRVDIRDPRLAELPVTSYTEPDLPDNRVQALYTGDGGLLLLGAPNGLYAYQPSPQAPELGFSHDGSAFDSLRNPHEPLIIDYNDYSPLAVRGADLRTGGDGLVFRFEISKNGDIVSQFWSANGQLPLSKELLEPGDELMLSAWVYDRDFNHAADPAVLRIVRQPEPLGLQERIWILAIALTVTVVALIWWAIGQLRFVRFQNLEVTLAPVTGRPEFQHVQLGTSRPFLRLPNEERPRLVEQISADLDQIQSLDELTDIDQKLDLLRKVGGTLFYSLFSSDTAELLRNKLGMGEKPLRLRLIIDSTLAGADALPWELLYGGDELGFLAIDADVALVRDYPPYKATPKKVHDELKTLLLISTPLPLDQRIIDKEIEALSSFAGEDLDAVRGEIERSGRFKSENLAIIRHASQEDLQDMTAGGYDLIHFLGHGDLEDGADGTSDGILYFEDNGDLHPIRQDVLVEHFAGAQPTFVFLNACRSAEADGADGAAVEITLDASRQGSNSLAAALVTEANIPAVVGMGYEFDSEAANEFSRAFYQKLVQLGQVDDAVTNGREVLSNRNTTNRFVSVASRDWFTPRLYFGLKDNAIYKQSLRRQHRLIQALREKFAK
jgi:ligand-binding sensor domain-containing protein